ncbi:response regulator [Pseudoroseomonas globiformis]|uniref:histidine kinase n=1 Tax=Teichococcus globiformis TaxID=2307229 RepID=A0ABV7G4F6_9PROT
MNELRQELLAAFAIEHREHLGAIRTALTAAEQGRPFDLRDVFRRAHSLKGAARAVDLPAVEAMAHRLEAQFAAMGENAGVLDAARISALQALLDAIEDHVARPEGPGEQTRGDAPLPAPDAGESAAAILRISTAQVESLNSAGHAIAAALAQQTGLQEGLRALAAALGNLRGQVVPAGQGQSLARELEGLRVQAAALARAHRGAMAAAEAATASLRRATDRMALVPAESVLGGLAPMVREMLRESGSEARLRVEGLEIQADRAVLQALRDPAMHLLRNAVRHGLEPPAARLAAGRPPEGSITLRLAIDGALLLLTVEDDGPGPDLPRIEAVAVQRGLVPARPPGQPPPPQERLLALVFEPGFSTASEVDLIAGRGIGLSVVAEAARRLQGSVILRPRRPHGVAVEVAVPLSAARQSLILAEAAGHTYALPARGVERVLRVRYSAVESIEGRPVLRISVGGRDVIVPVVTLASLIGYAPAPQAANLNAVLLRSGVRRCAVVVERLHDVQSLAVEAVQAPLSDPALIMGAALRQGEPPVPVLSPEALMGRWIRDHGMLTVAGLGLAATPDAGTETATILVVDDSITTRTLEKSILESQGFRVLLSVDGLDALTRLRGGEAVVDLVIADVEMPRMDGFALLQAMKDDLRLASIPVILMTSRATAEDVRRGLELGAGAYITKQKFDQRELLATIGQML